MLDIETAPNLAYVWGFWKQNVGVNQIKENGYMLSWAAKWLGEELQYYADVRNNGSEKQLLEKLWPLLDEAYIVVAHNGAKFDLPKINGRFLINGIQPPSPVKVVDTWQIAKRQLGLPANSLAYLSEVLDLPNKKDGHKKFPGFELWAECLKNNIEAWEEMKEYNIVDILALEDLYMKLRPYAKGHPNVAIQHEQEEIRCPVCGGNHYQRRGFYTTNVSKFQRYNCNDCGTWFRSRYTELPKEVRKNQMLVAR